jgi:hypothetical protein
MKFALFFNAKCKVAVVTKNLICRLILSTMTQQEALHSNEFSSVTYL